MAPWMKLLRQLYAILLLPFMAVVVAPGLIVYYSPTLRIGWSWPPPLNLLPPLLGSALIAAGLTLMAKSIWLFATVGQGTLAPWDPTQRLVVRGVYRHVRNPMITGVFCVILGEAALLGSRFILYWFVFFAVLNALYISVIEEPGLERRFGQAYVRYRQHVPRWLPRLSPWTGADEPED